MKSLVIFNLLCIPIALASVFEVLNMKSDREKVVASAISDVIKNVFSGASIKFELFIFEGVQSDDESREIVAHLMKSSGFEPPRKLSIVKIAEDSGESFKHGKSAVLFFDSLKLFNEFMAKVELTNNEGQIYFLIYFPFATADKILASLTLESSKIFSYFAYFIIDGGDGFITLNTILYYTPEACQKPQLIEVNRFFEEDLQWYNYHYNTNKFDNFHGCRVVFAIDYDPGYISELIKTLASHFNFDPVFKQVGAIEEKQVPVDVLLSPRRIIEKTADEFVTATFTSYEEYYLIPPGELYTSFEKLILPFDLYTWLLLVALFLISAVMIIVVKRKPSEARQTEDPSMGNLFVKIFGLPHFTLPRKNFARFLMIMFIVYSAIMRIVYNSKTFEGLKQEMRKPEIGSIGEMIAKNFTVYTIGRIRKDQKISGLKYNALKSIKDVEEVCLMNLNDPTSKSALFVYSDQLKYVTRNYIEPHRLLQQKFPSGHIGISMPRNHFLFQGINKKIGQLLTGGMIQKLVAEGPHPQPENFNKPNVIKLGRLAAGFSFWLFCLLATLMVFGVEIGKMTFVFMWDCVGYTKRICRFFVWILNQDWVE